MRLFTAFQGCLVTSPQSTTCLDARALGAQNHHVRKKAIRRLSPSSWPAAQSTHQQRRPDPLTIQNTRISTSTTLWSRRSSDSSPPSNDFSPIDDDDDDFDHVDEDPEYLEKIREAEFLTTELERVEGMEEILEELEEYYLDTAGVDDADMLAFEEENKDDPTLLDDKAILWSEKALEELLGDLPDDDSDDDDDDDDFDEDDFVGKSYDEDDIDEEILEQETKRRSDTIRSRERTASQDAESNGVAVPSASNDSIVDKRDKDKKDDQKLLGTIGSSSPPSAFADLERALMEGVVPVSANVGSDCLPGDFGFDPLNLASKDYFRTTQNFFLNLLPEPDGRDNDQSRQSTTAPRPRALILRDYREAEIRHGRLAMLAALFWPLQEMLDRLLLDPDQAGPLLYGPVTLPYFPLLMTFIMLNLGYLDIYSQAIKDRDSIGEAFLPGDCFWDPLRILEGAPDSMKRNMQERELFNGRVAMLAVAAFTWEEAITHLPLVEVGDNELLLEPAYQVPYIQEWLDRQFTPFTPYDPPTESTNLKMLMDEVLDTTLESLE